jgi:hypothetical protein
MLHAAAHQAVPTAEGEPADHMIDEKTGAALYPLSLTRSACATSASSVRCR